MILKETANAKGKKCIKCYYLDRQEKLIELNKKKLLPEN